LEVGLLGGGILLSAGIMSTGVLADADRAPALLFLPVSLLVWAAVRFGPLGLMSALSLLLVFAVVGASQQAGPFVGRPAAVNVFTLQLFLLGIGVPLFALAALAHEREQDRELLRQGRESYRAVVAKLPQSTVLRFGADLRHHSAVGQGLPHLGLSHEEIEGKTLSESFPVEMAATLEPHYRAALAGKHVSLALTHDGRTYQTEVMPVAAAYPPIGIVFLQDVTELHRAEELAATNAALEKLNQVKSAFVSVVSHEFRTPLTGIQAFSELLRDEEFPAERVREYAGDINREAERLSRMIGELLDLDRMESGRMTLASRELDLNALIEETSSTAVSQNPRHTLRLNLDPTLPTLTGDRDKLTQVIVNLLSNAVKYSPDGGEVTVGTRRNGDLVCLWVRDRGIGITPDQLETIFERYARLESGHHTPIQGTGLGLPIVRQIAELHGGRAWAESELGVGSTFHVTLPFRREPDAT
jgi:signal transduction histidine kinase